MTSKKRRHLARRLKALADIGNWFEPAIDGYLRLASRTIYRGYRPVDALPAPNPDVVEILWPSGRAPGEASSWLRQVERTLSTRYPFSYSDIDQPYNDILIFHLRTADGLTRVAVDVTDYVTRIEQDCLEEVDVYYKLQFANVGYDSPKVLPGNFLPLNLSLYSFIPALRASSLNQKSKSIDVYGRFGERFGVETRARAMSLLKGQSQFQFTGDLVRVSYARYLREMCRSKICIDLPGNGPLCFRLVEYLATGCCVIAYPHNARFTTPLRDREEIIYCREDMSDLVDLCVEYLQRPDERARIGANAARFFDRHIDITRLSDYYVGAASRGSH